ncbi:preprotein translocase subunit SecG [Parasphingopyxis algicola]|uniref:preprotein translocase subunit SecG n=1 Tax=Parasphingopyxis algicola TaxID=2026624 RepID=UPI0015A19F86|nr:preprotein translocase subunit SecG [Parasphingopyxis algicola]QLC24350.1 preprotein translocase subunit SecG [Parasphingopyxis algicola]
MFTFLLVVQAVIAALLVTLILMQRSEGGGLGVGGSSSGLMTARGQADFLTRATAVTAVAFVGLSILLAGLATTRQSDTSIDTSLTRQAEPVTPIAPLGGDAPASEPVDSDILSTIAGQAESSGTDEEDTPAE